MAQSLSRRMSRLVSHQFVSTMSVLSIGSTSSPSQKWGLFHQFANRGARFLSGIVPAPKKNDGAAPINAREVGVDHGATASLPPVLPLADAENFAAFAHANRHRKIKPFILKRRRKRLRTYVGDERDIRHSPWRMNLVCQFAAGLTVPEALRQLMFCRKVKAPLLAGVIRRTAIEADEQDGLQPSQLEVAECFSTHGSHLKRLKIMGRGRSGIKRRRHCHIRLVLREIDFPTKLLKARSINQKRKWLGYLRAAWDDYEMAQVERDELAELEAMAAKLDEEARKKKEEEEK